jgi:hypothetical protein
MNDMDDPGEDAHDGDQGPGEDGGSTRDPIRGGRTWKPVCGRQPGGLLVCAPWSRSQVASCS